MNLYNLIYTGAVSIPIYIKTGTCFEIFVKINFEEHPKYKEFFLTNNVTEILENISLNFGKKIIPGETLLFLDEIQTFPA